MAAEGFIGRWSRLKRGSDDVAPTGSGHVPAVPAGRDRQASPAEQADGASWRGMETAEGRISGETAFRQDSVNLPQAADAPAPSAVERRPLPGIDSLGVDSDYSPFMRGDVDPGLRLSALKKLFSDPHFNRMDGLDVYIDDYSKPDPMPLAFLRRLDQSRLLGLSGDTPAADESAPVAEGGAPVEEGGTPVVDAAPVDDAASPVLAEAALVRVGSDLPAPDVGIDPGFTPGVGVAEGSRFPVSGHRDGLPEADRRPASTILTPFRRRPGGATG